MLGESCPFVALNLVRRLLPLLASLAAFPLLAADFTVSNTAAGGAGSLWQAILDANATAPGPNRVLFAIPGTPPFTIQPTNTLLVTRPVVIDGASQPGYAGKPIILLNGTSVGGLSQGIVIFSGGSTVRGLALNRYVAEGIVLRGLGTNRIEGNYIGTDLTGTNVVPNGGAGVYVQIGSSGNVIGGIYATQRNIISGSAGPCVAIADTTTRGNWILGNVLGRFVSSTNAAGVSNLNSGVYILDARSNVIGGSVSGAMNIISGNNESGITISGTNAQGNRILGNIIGLGEMGTNLVRNAGDGITIKSGIGNVVGGTAPLERNVISGNARAGIYLLGGARDNAVQGNFIGTDVSGRLVRSNQFAGVTISIANNNLIGGSVPGAGNVISGNSMEGVFISTNSFWNRIEGNFIGLDATGTNRLNNLASGIAIDNASSNTIGGFVTGARNVISGNRLHGVYINGRGAARNVIQGNYIGTDVTGSRALGNLAGVWIEDSPSHQIGGDVTGAGNVISGNTANGINLSRGGCTNNTIQGNFIGTDASGAFALGNGGVGVNLADVARNTVGGLTALARNLISGNTNAGVALVAAVNGGSSANQVLGNFIGSDVTGTLSVSNRYEGIFLQQSASNIIGGVVPGAGNLISGNGYRAIYLENACWNIFQGNFVGTTVDGYTPLTNGLLNNGPGFELKLNSTNNLIGGTAPGAGNRIAYTPSLRAGIRVRNNTGNGNAFLGNAIFATSALGIELGAVTGDAVGANPNDSCDPDTGPNLWQNFPVLSNSYAGATVRISGSFNSTQGRQYRLEFFANRSCNVAGNGNGELYLGFTNITLGATCSNNFTVTLPVAVPAEFTQITATATDPQNNTSEFSACAPIIRVPAPAVGLVAGAQPQGPPRSFLTWTWAQGLVPLTLWETHSIAPPNWTPVPGGILQTNAGWYYSVPATNAGHFYKLSLP